MAEETQTAERPSWLPEKFTSAESLAESYGHLEKKLGGFTGAPESYEVSVEGLSAEDAKVKGLMNLAREANMNNETLNKILEYDHKFGQEDATAFRDEQLKLLGDKADDRLKNISDWAKNNIQEEFQETLNGLAETAKGVEFIENVMGMLKESSPASNDYASPNTVTAEEVREMQFKTNEHGDRLMSIDPAYKQKVLEAMAKLQK